MLALSLTAQAAAHTPTKQGQPIVDISLPADPHQPAIATMTSAGRSYRMLLDTGADDIFFHLPVAQRDLLPAQADPTLPSTAIGLHGDVEFRRFKADGYTVGGWTFKTYGEVLGVDMTRAVTEFGVDGILGITYLSQLDWHWDNRSGRLQGYAANSPAVALIRARLHCEPLLELERAPGVYLRVGDKDAPFVIDSGDMGVSGNIDKGYQEALAHHDAIRESITLTDQIDASGNKLPPLQLVQIQNVQLGPTRLDGLVFGEVQGKPRLGAAFLRKFDEVLLDMTTGKFCYTATAQVAPDDLSVWE